MRAVVPLSVVKQVSGCSGEIRLAGLLIVVAVYFVSAYAAHARAQTITVPTGSDTRAVLVEFGTCSGSSRFGTKLGQFTVVAPAAGANVEMQPGTYCFRAARIDAKGVQGKWGATRQRTIAAATFELEAP